MKKVETWFRSQNWKAQPFQKQCWKAYAEGKSGDGVESRGKVQVGVNQP